MINSNYSYGVMPYAYLLFSRLVCIIEYYHEIMFILNFFFSFSQTI